jgi:HNH endonuclease
MPFIFATAPHVRKHGPGGYRQYQTYKDWLRDEFTFRCVYCLERERWYPNGHAGFGVDHVRPKGQAEYEHLICHYPNLVYACNRCNSAKQDCILIDPCEVAFADHLRIDEEGEIRGLTVEGRRVINILGLDLRLSTDERKARLNILALYKRYPDDAELQALYFGAFGFPDDLPDLSAHSRATNTKPEGVAQCYHRQREAGTLPRTYDV